MLVSQCDTERTPYKSLFEVDGITKASEINCTVCNTAISQAFQVAHR